MSFPFEKFGIERGTLKWHVLAWLIYILYASSIIIPYPDIFIIDILLANIVSILCFYSCIPFITKFGARKYIHGFVLFLVSIVSFFVFRWLLYWIFVSWLNRKDVPSMQSKQFWIEGLYIYIHFLLNAIGYYFLKRSTDRQKIITMVSEEKARVQLANTELEMKVMIEERKRNIAEANFLRAQINPHFLQNTLNFIYAQSITGNTKQLSEGILLLSDMMRYSLQNQGDSNARVPLADEVQHLRNYIAINQLRFDGKLQVIFNSSGSAADLTIIPLVLLTLLENAFKHGELFDPAHPLQLNLQMEQKEGSLLFEVNNKIKTGPRERSTGIGIENTKRRLDSAYPGQYDLQALPENGFYKALLRVQLGTSMAA